MVKNKTNKNDKRSQKGRSMVEMLGVLAIIGVLSVGGVYGYGVAMKKHKANELLHQASMLATTISAQILTDKPLNIQDFGDSKYGTFNPPSEANAEQFTMQITGMDEAVCTQVAKMSGGMVRKAECNGTTLTLTYNNNLSSDKVAADYNGKQDECVASGRKYCSGSSSCVALDKECGCSGTNNGCQKCDTETGSFITDDEKEGENCTTADGKKGMCNAGVCKLDYTGVECTDYQNNTECGGKESGWYCQFSPSSYSASGTGTCTAVGSGTPIKDGAYLKSPDPMDWWSAYSWCKGNGMEPVTGTRASIPLNSDYDYWAGNGPLYQYFGGDFEFWTGHDKGDSRSAWRVIVYSNYENVAQYERNYDGHYALCQE